MTENQQSNSGDSEDEMRGIFKSLDEVKQCLFSEKYRSLHEVQELLDIFKKCCSTSSKEIKDRFHRKPFIVLEGIDASGKTTVSRRLAKMLGGCQLSTPPPVLLELRNKFDEKDTELRRAYYSLGNYIAAEQIKQLYETKPIVMDRFWHSTSAYALAHGGSVPPEGHEVYSWPADLLKPDIVFFLEVSEQKRLERLMNRKGKPVTAEEIHMKDDKVFRDNLLITFTRFADPKQIRIDSDVTVEEVLLQLKDILKTDYNIETSEVEPYKGS